MWRALIVIALMLIPHSIQSAWAQTAARTVAQSPAPGQGQLNTVAYREVPDRLSLSVTILDNSDLDLQIQERMIAALGEARHSVGPDTLFELELSSEMRTGGYSPVQPSLGELSSSNDNTELQMNIWSNTKDSILGGRQSGVGGRAASSFEIRASLRERSLGEVVWEGRAIVLSEREQARVHVAPMVAALVEHMGRTLRDGTFPAQ